MWPHAQTGVLGLNTSRIVRVLNVPSGVRGCWKASDSRTKSGCEQCNSPLHFFASSVNPASSSLLPRFCSSSPPNPNKHFVFCSSITNLHGTEIRQSDGHKSEAVGVISKIFRLARALRCRPLCPSPQQTPQTIRYPPVALCTVFLFALPWTPPPSQDASADAGCLCDKAAVIRAVHRSPLWVRVIPLTTFLNGIARLCAEQSVGTAGLWLCCMLQAKYA